jgi:ATP-binding cassette subfamily B protein
LTYRKLFKEYVSPQWKRFTLLAFLVLMGIGLQIITPQIIRDFIDTAISSGPLKVLFHLAFFFLGLAFVQQVLSVLAASYGEDLGWRTTNRLRSDLTEHCLTLDLHFHYANTPGEMIERIDGDITALSNFFSRFFIVIAGNFLLLIGILIVVFFEDWRAGIALTGFATFVVIVLLSIRGISVPHWMASRQASAKYFGFMEERLSGTEDIRANGAIEHVLERFFSLLRERMVTERKGGLVGSFTWAATSSLFLLGMAIAFGIGYYLYQRQALSLGSVYLLFHYTEMLRRPIETITRQIEDLQKATTSIRRIAEIMGMESRVRDGFGGELSSGAPTIEFKKVSFGYQADEPILKDVSFELRSGKALGLLGRTGSGKTTITRLLARLYDPDSGCILWNGTDIRQVPLEDLRHRIGVVTQDAQWFHASVRDNLTMFNSEVSDEHIIQIIEELGLSEWFKRLPEGLNTILKADGDGLSAGQAQLLVLGRVFLKNPELIIMDEASSRLDPATEKLIDRAVTQLLRNRTAIIIAHRLSTIECVDEIIVLDTGRIIEQGQRGSLERNPMSRLSLLLEMGAEVNHK